MFAMDGRDDIRRGHGAIEAPANASLEQVSFYTESVYERFKQTPEFQNSFQITLPSGGFGGMLVKPWTERDRTIMQISEELNPKLAALSGIRAPVFLPPPLPSAGLFPVEFVVSSTADHEELVRMAEENVPSMMGGAQDAGMADSPGPARRGARKAAKKKRAAKKVRKGVRKAARKARKGVRKAGKKARKGARKAARNARKGAKKAARGARKARRKASRKK
jgi:hypothetical protein